MQKLIEDKSFASAKRRFFISLVFLCAGVIYTIFPIDFIPDFLGPVGWVDDISVLIMTALLSAQSYYKMKKLRNAASSHDSGPSAE
ncbi:MAG TPA: DUF1232 domain-containing protein [Spirochaetota bacterium]|nr:DUF1232 domain-containing protein [Spirochaetota bacterium]HPQ53648.1 DUF1232 domain-containing protein [Spirochaetota bacterium]